MVWPVGRAPERYKYAIVIPRGELTLDALWSKRCFPSHVKAFKVFIYPIPSLLLPSILLHLPQGKKTSLLLRNVIIPVSFGQDIVSVSLGCSPKGTSEATIQVCQWKRARCWLHSQRVYPSMYFLLSAPLSSLYNLHHLAPKRRREKQESGGKEERRKGAREKVVLTDIVLGWSCKTLAFQMPGLNFWISRPLSSPPSHLSFFLSLRLEVATAAQLSALVMGGQRPNVMRSDRVLFENPVQIGHWDSQGCLFLPAFVQISTRREEKR